jgi:hypothetical protein
MSLKWFSTHDWFAVSLTRFGAGIKEKKNWWKRWKVDGCYFFGCVKKIYKKKSVWVKKIANVIKRIIGNIYNHSQFYRLKIP